ncbi:MAG: cysteine hydrolase [Acidobacteriaceae bacterium]|jgi:nicotinamidase-related amidase|nr:cysteine hydrolase [Acidobacteriaceae bacterium]
MTHDTRRTALLVMDVQPGIIDRVADKDAFLARAQAAVDYARTQGMRVIQVVVGFRPGAPEANALFRTFAPMLVGAQPVMTLGESDILVTKKRVSAFTGSDLEVVLRANDIRHLVLCGIATSGVVLSTIREAADKDYTLTVLSDLCADQDPEVHRVLLEKVFSRAATVTTSTEWRGVTP